MRLIFWYNILYECYLEHLVYLLIKTANGGDSEANTKYFIVQIGLFSTANNSIIGTYKGYTDANTFSHHKFNMAAAETASRADDSERDHYRSRLFALLAGG